MTPMEELQIPMCCVDTPVGSDADVNQGRLIQVGQGSETKGGYIR